VNRFDQEPGLHGVISFASTILPRHHRSMKLASDVKKLGDWTLFPPNAGDLTRTDRRQRVYIRLITRNILKLYVCIYGSCDSSVSVGIVNRLNGGGLEPRQKYDFSCACSTQIQHPAQRVLGLFAQGKSGLCVKLTAHLHLVSSSRMV
jgi:hypothetical protein